MSVLIYHGELTTRAKPVARATFRPSTPDDEPAIADFLRRTFDAPANHPLASAAHMQWKYWRPLTFWPGTRSYILEKEGRILAHGAAWPSRIQRGSESLSVFELIDWAADPHSPGAGFVLGSKMLALADVVFIIGGTEAALRTRSAMGFTARNRVQLLAKPLRPLRQIRSDQARNWRTPARLLRNMLWSRRASLPRSSEWSVTEVPAAEVADSALLRPPAGTWDFGENAELAQYLAECPIVRSAFRLVRKGDRPAGYFSLTFAPGQARIADCSLIEPSTADWTHLYRLAIAEAGRDADTNEIIAWSTTESQRDALLACGFHVRRDEEIVVCDSRKRLAEGEPLHPQMIHTDAAFIHDGVPAYLT